jgi:hypothetical protein
LTSCGNDCVGVRHASCAPRSDVVSSSDGIRVSWPMYRELVGRDAGVGADDARFLRRHARQPRALDELVRLGALGRLVAQARDDRHVLAVRLERLENPRHLEVTARLLGHPVPHDGAVREADEG